MTKSLAIDQRANMDTESRGIIYQGASVNQLADLFRMKTPDVLRRLGDLKPIGVGRQNNPIYDVAQAAARLIRIPVTAEMIDGYMRRVNARDLPPILNKIYWEGLMVRERYREQAGELWHTEDVARVASDAFQSLRMSVLLIPDALRDGTDLSERQFTMVQEILDKALEESRVRLVADLRKPNRSPTTGTVSTEENWGL
jgi:UDP:flavonoid glycosyltransferase YjiC (YdhE family)